METGSVKWKLLVSTPDEAEAYSLKSRLDSEGLRSRIETDDNFASNQGGGMARDLKLYVALEDFEASQQVADADLDEE
jgi:hypothetical protein